MSHSINKLFTANGFNVLSFGGTLAIEPWRNGETTVEITIAGPADRVDAIRLNHRGVAVTMEDPRAREGSGGSGVTVTSRNGSVSVHASGNSSVSNIQVNGMNISMRGSAITVNGVRVDAGATPGKEAEAPLSAVVRVPVGAAIEIANLFADGTIGDTCGPVSAAMTGHADLTIGRIGAAQLSVQGSGDIRVREVIGSLTASIQGSGDINVTGGRVDQMTGSVMGSGDLTFRGAAKDATLALMGSGDITVARVTGRLVKSRMGTGDITVN